MAVAVLSAAAAGRGRILALVAGFTAAHFAHHVSNSLLSPLLPLIRGSFRLSYAEAGTMVTAYTLCLGFSNLPLGALADRIGSRPVMAAGLVLTGLASVVFGLTGAYWQAILALIALGVVSGSYHAPAAALISRLVPDSARGMAQGVHITGGHLSFFVAPLLAAGLASGGDWRLPFLVFAPAPILFGILVWLLVPSSRDVASSVSWRSTLAALRTVVRLVGPLVTLSMVVQVCYAALSAFLALYLVDARGFSPPVAAILFGVPQLLGLLGAPAGGWLSDRLGRRNVLLLALGLVGPSYVALTLVPNDLVLLPLGVLGIAASMRQTVSEVLVMDSAPNAQRASILGGYHLLAQPIGGVAAPLVGLLAGAIGIGNAFGAVALGCAALSITAVLLGRRL